MSLLPIRSGLSPFRSELLPFRSRPLEWDIMGLQEEMDNLLNNFFGRSSLMTPRYRSMEFCPLVDVKEQDGKYLLEAEVPGMKEDEIDLDLHDNILTIKGEKKSTFEKEKEGYCHAERCMGAFRRDIPFAEQVDDENVKADLKNGVLHIELMKKDGKIGTHKRIKIKH